VLGGQSSQPHGRGRMASTCLPLKARRTRVATTSRNSPYRVSLKGLAQPWLFPISHAPWGRGIVGKRRHLERLKWKQGRRFVGDGRGYICGANGKTPSKTTRGAKRKSPKRRTELKSSAWYQTAVLSVAIPLDRRNPLWMASPTDVRFRG